MALIICTIGILHAKQEVKTEKEFDRLIDHKDSLLNAEMLLVRKINLKLYPYLSPKEIEKDTSLRSDIDYYSTNY